MSGAEAAVGDAIELRGLRLTALCGVLPEEQERPQPIEVDLDLRLDLTEAGRSDDLAHTVDYATVLAEAESVVAAERFALLERLAARLADTCLQHARVASVTVVVRKLRPLVPQQLATTGVRLTRSR